MRQVGVYLGGGLAQLLSAFVLVVTAAEGVRFGDEPTSYVIGLGICLVMTTLIGHVARPLRRRSAGTYVFGSSVAVNLLVIAFLVLG